MIINFQEKPYSAETAVVAGRAWAGSPARCLVDGKEINCVWYADTEAGIVKTYDVLGDGKAHATRELIGFGTLSVDSMVVNHRLVEAPIDGVVSVTLSGKVELL